MSRNELCACGSGKRFKNCHGSVASPVTVLPPPFQPAPATSARFEALAAQRAGALGRAEGLYLKALQEDPQDVDSLHMLGVVQYERMRYRDSLALLLDAAERTGWNVPVVRHNIGLVIGKLMSREANERQQALLAAFTAHERERQRRDAAIMPLVSVVVRTCNDQQHVLQALESVAAQSWPRIEVIIVDDGSTDMTAAVVAQWLETLPAPARLVVRPRIGITAAFNAGAALATGDYLAFLDGCDYFAAQRIERMVDEISRGRAAWGFSRVALADARPGEADDSAVTMPRNFLAAHPNSFTLLEYNIVETAGNLFVARDLFTATGGFRVDETPCEWPFCVRAARDAEPVALDDLLYWRRPRIARTTVAAVAADTANAERMSTTFLAGILGGTEHGSNELGPNFAANRTLLLRAVFRAGHGARVPVAVMQALAARWQQPATARSGAPHRGVARSGKTAIVVLGMHRSGTSAMARVLNLCGAFLPEKVMPPKLGVNPTGFWEAEAVVDLDARLIAHLGGEWNRVDFDLPDCGELVDEFEADALAVLAGEYESRELIVIKDPRICVLAPLWHRALLAADYRPVYVVPLRNPLDVAESLRARGDMSIDEGLALWRAYLQRVEAFTTDRTDVVYARYDDLLDDWRGVVVRIGAGLGINLDLDSRAAEVDRFLEPTLRNHNATDEALMAHLAGGRGAEIRELYARLESRCVDAHAGAAAEGVHADGPVHAQQRDRAASATFVLCIENNAIREQALLLCESIRRYAGRHARAQIIAYSPRAGLVVDRNTRALLAELNVDYVDEPLNTLCPEYVSANRVFASAHAERHARGDFVIAVDSDTVWLDEPALLLGTDIGVRPVDEKGSATSGPGDPFEPYWQALAELCGVSLQRLPWLRTTIAGERVRASYNGGLTVARRQAGVFTRCAELFAASVHAGIRPFRGTGIDIVASTGSVGRAGSEYWGACQAALSLAAWASTTRVTHYPDSYNVPLPLLGSQGEVDPRWLAQAPVHVHYHHMFGSREQEVALELLGILGTPDEPRDWLRMRLAQRQNAREPIGAQ
ncbi:MAG: glycosyltransferase [Casimicrobiaceae bacterium]